MKKFKGVQNEEEDTGTDLIKVVGGLYDKRKKRVGCGLIFVGRLKSGIYKTLR